MKQRETVEKMRAAQERKAKMEAEKAAAAEKRKILVNLNAEDDQEGVMDNLLLALQSGEAFGRGAAKRARPQPRTSAGNVRRLSFRKKINKKRERRVLPSFCSPF
jgi:hypothetical protein